MLTPNVEIRGNEIGYAATEEVDGTLNEKSVR
jgi:hypothetical protein